ncbi:MAG: hypothetical protein FH761_02375 [Firmicutes bacterium]|nr:hypothetical protein [Bacillota bacterium]
MGESKSKKNEIKNQEKDQDASGKQSSGKIISAATGAGVSGLAKALKKLGKVKEVASKVLDVGKIVGKVAKEISKNFSDIADKAVKASEKIKKATQQKKDSKEKQPSASPNGGSSSFDTNGLSNAFDKLGKLKDIALTVSNVGMTVANVAKDIGGAFMDMATKTADASLEISKISEKTGLSTTQLQELKYTASQTGAEFSGIQNAAISMGESMASAQEGNNIQAEAFQALGVSLEDAQGNLISTDEAFSQVITKLSNMANETERNALATQIFGDNATELTPLLEEGGEGLQKYKDRANELGLVMSGSTIEANAKFAETMGTMKETVGKLKSEFQQVGEAVMNQIGSAVIPILQTLFDWILDNMPMIQKVIGTVFSIISESVGFFIDIIKQLINWIIEWAASNEENLTMIKEMIMSWFEAIKAEIDFFVGIIETVVEYIKELWQRHGEEITIVIQNIWNVISAIIQTAVTLITDIFNIFAALFKGDWEGLWNGIKKFFSDIWNGVGNIINESIEYLKSVIKLGLEFIDGIFNDIWNGIKQFFSDIWQGISNSIDESIKHLKTTIKIGLEFVSGIFDSIWNGIKEFFSDIWEGIGNTIDESIEGIKSTVNTGLEFVKGVFDDIWGGIKETVTDVWEGIVDGIKGSINTIIEAINKLIRGMNKLKIKLPTGKTLGFNIPTIPLLAEGTDYFKGGLAIVGEKGPELLNLPRGAQVYSNKETQGILNRSGITQNITINSPQPLSPSGIKRKTLEASRQLAMEWGV